LYFLSTLHAYSSDTIPTWFISAFYRPQLIEYNQKLFYPYQKNIYFQNGFGVGIQKSLNHGLFLSADLNYFHLGQKTVTNFDWLDSINPHLGFNKEINNTKGDYASASVGLGKSFPRYPFLPTVSFHLYAMKLLTFQSTTDLYSDNVYVTRIDETTELYKDFIWGFSFSFQYKFMITKRIGLFAEPEFMSSFGNICSNKYLDAKGDQFYATALSYSLRIGSVFKF